MRRKAESEGARPVIRMSVSTRVTLVLVLGFLSGLIAGSLIIGTSVWPKFVDLDREATRQDIVRSLNYFDTEIEDLDRLCRDWAFWDDTYQFAVDGRADYVAANLPTLTFADSELDAILIVDKNGKVVYGRTVLHDTVRDFSVDQLPLNQFPKDHPLFAAYSNEKPVSGLLETDRGVMLVSANPIMTSENEGPSRGVVIMGRIFDGTHLTAMREKLSAKVSVRLLERADMSSGKLTMRAPFLDDLIGDGTVRGHAVVGDVTGRPVVMVEVQREADMTRQGSDTLYVALALVISAGTFVFLGVWWVMQKQVVRPLERVTDYIVGLGEGGGLFRKISEDSADEFGVMAYELNRTRRYLSQVMHHDPLTQLANRSLFFDQAEHAVAVAERESAQAAILFIDLDGFKPVNDRLGHAIGDKLLRHVSRRLESSVRRVDTVSRLGGDEFTIVIAPVEKVGGVETVCTKILQALADPYEIDKEKVTISASIGVALYPDHGQTVEALVRAADAAMYDAKNDGRNRYRVYGTNGA